MSRYATWMKLIRVTAYVLRAVKLFKTRLKSEETELSAEKMKQAALNCLMRIQEDVFKEDYEQLKAGKTPPSSSRLLKLDPYYDKDDKVIRLGARLQFVDLHEENKHQIMLLHEHPAVAKLIQDAHRCCMHVQKLYFQFYDGRFGSPKEDVNTNVLSEDVCLARNSEMELAHRRWDHYPKKECQPSYHF